MIGPPSSPDRDGLMMGDFFGSKGKHIVCGGTTAHLAASYLGKPLEVVLDYQSSTIPPIGRIGACYRGRCHDRSCTRGC